MRHNHPFTGLLLAAFAAASAHAQDAKPVPDQASDDIIVTGQRQVEPEKARRFVRSVISPIDGQLARFQDPLCPGVAGLKADAALAIVDRMREVAAAAQAPVSPVGCKPNVVVIVAEDGEATLKSLQARGAFRGLTDIERRRALRSEGPVRAFSDVELLNDDGAGAGRSTVTGIGVGGTGAMMQGSIGNSLTIRTASILKLPTQQTKLRTILIFDAAATMGKSLTQIADHAAMRAFGGARPDSSADLGADTILSLFASAGSPPPSLTAMDLAFLKGVYSARPNQTYHWQVQQIADRMTAER